MRPSVRATLSSAAAVTATALVGGVGTTAGSRWYRKLDKPSWQPPPEAFGPVWTSLYVLLAYAGARAYVQTRGAERQRLVRVFGTNLALNASWTWLFFRLRRPDLALVGIGALNASNVALLRQAWEADRSAGVAVAPYVVWTAFATALNSEIVRRNPKAIGR